MKHKLTKAMRIRGIIALLFILFIASSFSLAQENDKELEIAYTYMNQGKTSDAIPIFESHLQRYPDDMKVTIQLAYAYKQIGKNNAASELFSYVAANSKSQEEILLAKNELKNLNKDVPKEIPVETQKEISVETPKEKVNPELNTDTDDLNKAYAYINQGEYKKAIDIFEKYKSTHPEDTKIRLQLAYLYIRINNYEKSLEYFNYLYANSKNPEEVDIAARSRYYLNDIIVRNSLSSMDFYFYNNYDTYFENYVSNLLMHFNFRLFRNANAGFYTDINMDTRSKPQTIYNDRYFEAGGFFKYAFNENIGFEFRTGYVRQIDLKKSSINFKPLVYAGTRLGNPSVYLGSAKSKSNNFYFDVFSMALYDYKYRNFFGQLMTKEVYRLMSGGYSYFEFYLGQMLLADSKQFDYNNYAEVGVGVGFKPDLVVFPVLFLEATNKTFLIGNSGQYLQGTLRNTFQFKAGFLFNFNTKL